MYFTVVLHSECGHTQTYMVVNYLEEGRGDLATSMSLMVHVPIDSFMFHTNKPMWPLDMGKIGRCVGYGGG